MNTDSRALTFKESRTRSLVKSVSYRLMSISGTALLTWLITRSVGKTLSITIANQLFLIFLYYSSERLWNRIKWGKKIVSCGTGD
jgi:uncharacterized membrane protein